MISYHVMGMGTGRGKREGGHSTAVRIELMVDFGWI